MPRIAIDSLDDPRLAEYRNLKETNATRSRGTFVAEGEKLARRLLASDFPVVSVLVDTRHEAAIAPLVPRDVPHYVVPIPLVEKLVGFNFHRGILACGRRKPQPSLEEIASPHEQPLTLAVCVDVQDPENLGAIARIASSFGAGGLLVGPQSCEVFSRRVLRVSMGAVWRIPIIESADFYHDLDRLRELDIELVATVLDADAEPLTQVNRPPRVALLLGNEGHGLPSECIARCQRRVTIPMQPGTDSLNVAAAAAIFLHHFCQRF